MSYAKELHKKLQLHKETDLVDIQTDIDTILSMSSNAVNEYEKIEKHTEITSSKILDLEEDLMHCRRSKIKSDVNETFGLLGVQIEEAFGEVLFHQNTNQLELLNHLQKFVNNGYREPKHEASY